MDKKENTDSVIKMVIVHLEDHSRPVKFTGGRNDWTKAIENRFKDVWNKEKVIDHFQVLDPTFNTYIDVENDDAVKNGCHVKAVLKMQQEDIVSKMSVLDLLDSQDLEETVNSMASSVASRAGSFTSMPTTPKMKGSVDERRERRQEEIVTVLKAKLISYKVDICFLLDCTGSMLPWIEKIKSNIAEWKHLLQRHYHSAQLRFAFVRYTDFDQPSDTRTTFIDFTIDPKKFTEFVDAIKIHDGCGGDTPEDVLGGLKVAVNNLSWSSDEGTKTLVHIADSPCHGTDFHNDDMKDDYPQGDVLNSHVEILKALYQKKIQYCFGYIKKKDTDKMISAFNTVLKDVSKKREYIMQLNATDPESVDKLIADSLEATISETEYVLSGAIGEQMEEVLLDNTPPCWDTMKPEVGCITPPVNADLTENYICDLSLPSVVVQFKCAPRPFAKGKCRKVYHGLIIQTDEHNVHNTRVVLKQSMSKKNALYKRYLEDYHAHCTAMVYATLFNKDKPATVQSIKFISPQLLKPIANGDGYFAVEPFIEGKYEKFNNNFGYVADHLEDLNDVLQAFSHYTWQKSGYRLLVCDLQGVKTSNGILLTDPCIHSCQELILNFGRTNLGVYGMAFFFKTHKCNKVCTEMRLVEYKMKDK